MRQRKVKADKSWIGATPEGKKELVGLTDGVRESTRSWNELLLDLKRSGLSMGPELAVADGGPRNRHSVWPRGRACSARQALQMGGRSSFMGAQIRGDEKSGNAAQTPRFNPPWKFHANGPKTAGLTRLASPLSLGYAPLVLCPQVRLPLELGVTGPLQMVWLARPRAAKRIPSLRSIQIE